jgi:hypothetical protein
MLQYRKQIFLFTLFFFVGICLLLVLYNSKSSEIPLGNHPAIIVSYGTIAADNEGIYYECRNGNSYALCSMKYDGSEIRTLVRGSIGYINVLDGWIYYRKWRDTNATDGIYKMRTDGSQEQRLIDNKGFYINLAGDWIYYTDNEPGSIWKIKTDGSNSQKIYTGQYHNLTTDGEYLYFCNWHMDSLFKASCDGQRPIQTISGKFHRPFVYKDWIYYRTDHGGICRMNKTNFEPDTLIKGKEYYHYVGKNMIPADDTIYCSGNYGISRFSISENKLDTLSTMYAEKLGFRGKYIFFTIEEKDEHDKPYDKAFCMTLDSLKKRNDPKNWLQTYDESSKHYKENIQWFIDCIKNNDRATLSKLVYYPLDRDYPLPSIKTADDFLKRFDEVFDKKFIDTISHSDIDKDWEEVGGHEVMLKYGRLCLEYDGKLLSINYESEIEKKKRNELIEADRNTLHSSLKDYIERVLEWKTKHYHIRIDRVGEYMYRYASWRANKLPSDKPDLIISNGEWEPLGSGGNHQYSFRKGIYLYRCYVGVMRSWDEPPGRLEVYKLDIFRPEPSINEGRHEEIIEDEELILTEPVIWSN